MAIGAAGVSAQSLRGDTGPAELPPSDYEGRQYADSEGCVYIRAGVGDTVTWVPRVTRDRKVLCGQTPTFAEAAPAPAKPRPSETPAPETAGADAASAPAMMEPAGPRAVSSDVPPPAERPRARSARRARPATVPAPKDAAPEPAPLRVTVAPRPLPEGYERAWDDGRLNPARGRGTAEGAARMARIWTSTVPRRLASAAPEARLVWQDDGATTRLAAASTKSPAPAHAGHVQVGAFARAANAARLGDRLRRRGLPVAIEDRGGLRIVLAGPFGSDAETARTLGALRRAGFTDAFIR